MNLIIGHQRVAHLGDLLQDRRACRLELGGLRLRPEGHDSGVAEGDVVAPDCRNEVLLLPELPVEPARLRALLSQDVEEHIHRADVVFRVHAGGAETEYQGCARYGPLQRAKAHLLRDWLHGIVAGRHGAGPQPGERCLNLR